MKKKYYYYDFSSLDYTIDFLILHEGESYRPSGNLHGPFGNLREAKKDARQVIKHYLMELKMVYNDIKTSKIIDV